MPDLKQSLDGVCYAQESVLEKVDVKRKLVEEIDGFGFDDLIVGSSTSGIPASDFGLDLKMSPRILVSHPVNPPYLVPIVELVGSPQTSKATIDFTDKLMQAANMSGASKQRNRRLRAEPLASRTAARGMDIGRRRRLQLRRYRQNHT